MLFSRQTALIQPERSREVAAKVSFPRQYRINSITTDNKVRRRSKKASRSLVYQLPFYLWH